MATLTIDKSNWELARLGDVAHEVRESLTKSDVQVDRSVGLEHIEPGDLHIRTWDELDESSSFTKVFREGHVLFGRRRAYLKKAALADFNGVCSGDITVISANEDLLPSLLPFVVSSDRFFAFAVEHSAGGLSPRVKWKDLANYRFLLPPKDQQAEIAELLWAMERNVEAMVLLRSSMETLSQAIQKEHLFDVDGKKIQLCDLLNVVRGVGYKPSQVREVKDSSSAFILRANNIQRNAIIMDDLKIVEKRAVKKEQYMQKGDFVVCMSNGSKALLGKSAQLLSTAEDISAGSFCAILRPFFEEQWGLIRCILASSSYRLWIDRLVAGSTINNLNASDLLKMSFRLSEDWVSTVCQLDELMLAKEQIEQAEYAGRCLRSAVLGNYLSGV